MPVKIHGKDYFTVAERLYAFEDDRIVSSLSVVTELLYHDVERVVFKASIINVDGFACATGHAEEYRNASKINATSALENCETSAIGRALAIFSTKYMGAAIASADEVKRAIEQQENSHRFKPGEKEEIQKQVRDALFNGNDDQLREVLDEYEDPEVKIKIWGLFNSTERAAIKGLLAND